MRIGLLYPVALSWRLFGINEASTHLFPLLCGLGNLVLLFLLGRTLGNPKAGLLAALLYAVFPLEAIHGTELLPDVPAEFFMTTSAWLFLMARGKKGGKAALFMMLSGLALGFAYLIKIVAPLLFIFFGSYWIFVERAKPKRLLSYVPLLLGFLIILALENAYLFAKTGEIFARIRGISGFTFRTKLGEAAITSSWLVYPRVMFVALHEFGLYYYFVFLAMFWCLFRKRTPSALVLTLWFLSIFLYLQFGSRSLTHYRPLSHLPRYLCVVTPPALLFLSLFLYDLKVRWLQKGMVLLLVISSIGFIHLGRQLWRIKAYNPKQIAVYLQKMPLKPVYADYGTDAFLRYLFGFKLDSWIKAYNVHDYKRGVDYYPIDLAAVHDAYVVVDFRRINFHRQRYLVNYPPLIFAPPSHWSLLRAFKNPFVMNGWEMKIIRWVLYLLPQSLARKPLRTLKSISQGIEARVYYVR